MENKKQNHEIRFSCDEELKTITDTLRDKFGRGISKQEFNKSLFFLGIQTFQDKTLRGFFPTFIPKQNTLQIIMKKNK